MKLNWSALLLTALGGLLLVVAWEGTHRKLWSAVTGQTQSSPSPSGAPFAPFGSPDVASAQQMNQRVCRDNPNAPACKQYVPQTCDPNNPRPGSCNIIGV